MELITSEPAVLLLYECVPAGFLRRRPKTGPVVEVVMTAAHAGYDSEQVPLGGGAAICERLCRSWSGRPVTLLGSGPQAPPGVNYRQFDLLAGRHPATLKELAYARFCRRFERACTEAILAHPGPAVVLSHDVSEGPDFARLARAGIPSTCILHVDVVEFFCRMYLRGWVRPEWATALHRRTRRWPIWPDVLRLVLDKQADAAFHSHLVAPSPGMRGPLERCYFSPRVAVIPWGSQPPPSPSELEPVRAQLRQEWSLGTSPLLVTLSRISPEKGQDILLQALLQAEERGQIPGPLTLAIIGSAAYMGGKAFFARLRGLASRLNRVRVIFPGHLGGLNKHAALSLADLMVVASRHESYGLTTMEAMAVGLPVVALESHGTRATLAHGGGVLVDSPEQLWPSIQALLGAPARRQELSRQALELAARETFEQASERLYELLQLSARQPERPGRAR